MKETTDGNCTCVLGKEVLNTHMNFKVRQWFDSIIVAITSHFASIKCNVYVCIIAHARPPCMKPASKIYKCSAVIYSVASVSRKAFSCSYASMLNANLKYGWAKLAVVGCFFFSWFWPVWIQKVKALFTVLMRGMNRYRYTLRLMETYYIRTVCDREI